MKLIIDATALDLYPVAKPGFHGGTELYVQKLATELPVHGHTVHVVANDLDEMEQRGEREFWWPKGWHPTKADAVVMVHNLENLAPYSADFLILASNGLGAFLGPEDEFATGLDAVACFSQCHIDLLCQAHPKVPREKCHITGLGVDLWDYHSGFPARAVRPTLTGETLYLNERKPTVPHRLLFSNDPQRGLWHVLDIFEEIQKQLPDASLHLTYDWERVFNAVKWGSNAPAALMWECRKRIESNPGITNLGALTREQVIREQLECQVHVMPSDPPNVGSQIHGITQMECAAAGCALVLSNIEAFPEVFGEAAEILPLPGYFDPRAERRWDARDWADVAVELMTDDEKWRAASQKARALAERNTWEQVGANWNAMLDGLKGA